MKNSSNDISYQIHFPDLDLGEDDLNDGRFTYLNVSIFDHWLTEGEAGDSRIMSYSIARSSGKIDEYMDGEKKFLELYRSLSKRGVICNRPEPLRRLDIADEELNQIFLNSLREQRSMDVFFVSCKARALGRYDRTGLFIIEDAACLSALKEEIARAGLFILV
ncbi:hypothetical protein ACC755_17840 [Rhizobium ruizarguesonis]|uniref:hypothetical protein n=1 Tax=Rhizobium ruizarguesonis TaxID=2081791 RepID=UPI0010323662|nr:hypothetical protein [Rhizobium ruizarguesonis]TAY83990.1 hypothetical protein ELH85_35780 [Rhizobium ruizarguesonis]TBA33532.1 hypothetical protein ELH62_31040 [Rhizobium ruizarguesonis]